MYLEKFGRMTVFLSVRVGFETEDVVRIVWTGGLDYKNKIKIT